ncbi:TPA: protein tyrosine phosphatase [Klebsiella aerogenes]|jgi:protein-tyrosine phosphatase|nr:protein tyrosine phosphatase [Klebsiella aerogenes]HBR7300970.1 protein tyrosine phosphatase [Klebsiella aerogenes]HCR0847475.1 protein tyrosine phosphatase [Klebsiella aerogenes]HCT1902790.1 protein tyrosine phosphatase [Klebsiella aerogenes]HEM8091201.1 protein tyrosine phosphatase [Klebsiella aerogenes]
MAKLMFDSILVVCTGNICRSPIGERLIKAKRPGIKVDSAGTGALVGHKADESAIRVAEINGLSLDGHLGKQFTQKLASQYGLILVMEKRHIEHIDRIAPEARGKVMLFGHWLNQQEIPDPYRKSDEAFSYVFQLLNKASQLWVEKLAR